MARTTKPRAKEPTSDQIALQVIDQRIADAEKELERLKRAAEFLPAVTTNLVALRRTRAILIGEAERVPTTHEIRAGDSLRMADSPPTIQAAPPSIGSITLKLLNQAKRPMLVRELVPLINARGNPANEATIVGALARYVKMGRLIRPARSTYGLPNGVTYQAKPSEGDFEGTILERK